MTIIYLALAIMLGLVQFMLRNKSLSHIISTLSIILQWAFTVYAFSASGQTEYDFFCFDGLALVMLVALSIISTAAFCHSNHYLAADEDTSRVRAQYYGAMQFLTMALTMAVVSVHIAMTWIFVEITTLSASALIFYRRNSGSIEATWKYVFACSISLVFVYVGILFFSIAMGENAETGLTIDELMAHASQLDPFWLKLAFTFILVGYTAKMSLVPMFTAGIDAKDKAPTPAAAMLSSVVMNAGFVGFYRVYGVVAHTEVKKWADMVVLMTGILSIFVAAVYLVRVKNVKRLFAYSSVEHMGVVMLGIAAGGVGIYAGILHLVLHSFVKSAIFMHIGQLYRVYGSKYVDCMGKYLNISGMGGTMLIFAMLCITAMPPSGMFVTEFMVFRSMIDAGQWIVMGVAMILLTVIVWAIGRDMFSILFMHASSENSKAPKIVSAPWYETMFQWVLIILSIWLGLSTPEYVSTLVENAAALVG
ncbi:MAG: hypothetical protein MJZ15_05895 [Bacteroidales bacterium]|nr:hypothetical protein [Bacteroidales bacterium]